MSNAKTIKGKVVVDEWHSNVPCFKPKGDVIYSIYDNDYIVLIEMNDEMVEIAKKQIGDFDIYTLPYNDYYYNKIPDEYEIDMPVEVIEKWFEEQGDIVIINPTKTEKALAMAITEGYVLNDDGEAVEPDAPDSPLRKSEVI